MKELPPSAPPESRDPTTVTPGVICPWCDEWNEIANDGYCAACGLELAATKDAAPVPKSVPARRFRRGSLLASAAAFSVAFALLFFGARLSLRTAVVPAILVGLVVRAILLRKRITTEEDDTDPDPR